MSADPAVHRQTCTPDPRPQFGYATLCKAMGERASIDATSGLVLQQWTKIDLPEDGISHRLVVHKINAKDRGRICKVCPFCRGDLITLTGRDS